MPVRRFILFAGFTALASLAAALSCKGRDTTGPSAVESVAVTPASATVLAMGETQQLTATALAAGDVTLGGQVITWTSSNAAVATVSAGGLVTPNFLVAIASTATITATSEGKSAAVPVVVNPPVAEYVITPSTMSLTVGQTEQLTWSAVDSLGHPLIAVPTTWLNLKAAIAALVVNGRDSALVTAYANGLDAMYPYVTTTDSTFNAHAGVVVTVGGLLAATRRADHPVPRRRRAEPAIGSR
jgi:plastocyanin